MLGMYLPFVYNEQHIAEQKGMTLLDLVIIGQLHGSMHQEAALGGLR